MDKFIEIDKNNISDLLLEYDAYIFSTRNSRIKAKQVAILESFFVLIDIDSLFVINGPLGDVKGIFCFLIHKKYNEENLKNLFERLGYVNLIYKLNFSNFDNLTSLTSINEFIWKDRKFGLEIFYRQDDKLYISQSAHNRKFIIKTINNENKIVYGYRGNGTALGSRGLPVEDCRCLLNLVAFSRVNSFIDLFAGGGGIVYQSKYFNKNVIAYSIDIDDTLALGLEYYGAKHFVGDASTISLDFSNIDAVVTEVPFCDEATSTVVESLKNINKYLSENANYSIMCAESQCREIIEGLSSLDLILFYQTKINRKGTDICILCYTKSKDFYINIENFICRLQNVF